MAYFSAFYHLTKLFVSEWTRFSSEFSDKIYDQNNRRMHPDKPCHTIAASFYANFVHPLRTETLLPVKVQEYNLFLIIMFLKENQQLLVTNYYIVKDD